MKVFAVIPAAGQSQRMGRPKQLLPFGERSLLEAVIEAVLGGEIDGLCVVTTGEVDAELALREDPRFITRINDDPRTEMLDSALIGLAGLREQCEVRAGDGVLVCPGDVAGVSSVEVRACAQEYRDHSDSIIVATHDGRRGHPIVMPLSLEPELVSRPPGGLRALLDRHPERVRTVDCASPGVLSDIDTPEDYAGLMVDRDEFPQ